jgi:hypothetical protein
MPLSTSDFAGDGLRLQNYRTEYATVEERTLEIFTHFCPEVESFLQCVRLSNNISKFAIYLFLFWLPVPRPLNS